MNDAGTLKEVVAKAGGDLLLFFIVLAVVIILVSVPMYIAISKAEEKKREHYIEREGHILNIVQINSEFLSEVRTIIKNSNDHCGICKAEQMGRFGILGKKQDDIIGSLIKIETALDLRKEEL
jgi:hypothetical protein